MLLPLNLEFHIGVFTAFFVMIWTCIMFVCMFFQKCYHLNKKKWEWTCTGIWLTWLMKMIAYWKKSWQMMRHGAFFMTFRKNVSKVNGEQNHHQGKKNFPWTTKVKGKWCWRYFSITSTSFTMNLSLKAKLSIKKKFYLEALKRLQDVIR